MKTYRISAFEGSQISHAAYLAMESTLPANFVLSYGVETGFSYDFTNGLKPYVSASLLRRQFDDETRKTSEYSQTMKI